MVIWKMNYSLYTFSDYFAGRCRQCSGQAVGKEESWARPVNGEIIDCHVTRIPLSLILIESSFYPTFCVQKLVLLWPSTLLVFLSRIPLEFVFVVTFSPLCLYLCLLFLTDVDIDFSLLASESCYLHQHFDLIRLPNVVPELLTENPILK